MLLRGRNIRKESGVLMHISSLPSPYFIGSLGIKAYDFIDFLSKANQRYWQILPLCPIGEGNSPYKSYSAFAGEILFIDLHFLVRDGYLQKEDLPEDMKALKTDYKKAKEIKLPLLKKAADNFDVSKSDYKRFIKENEDWLEPYSLFMAIKEKNNDKSFDKFPDGLKYRLPVAITEFKEENSERIQFYKITQYLFFKQYFALKNYASMKHIKIIGDIPFYVSFDSADVWENPEVFRLGRDMTPVQVAGVPPDIFSKEGQLWGNPIYDWDLQKKTNYLWWRKRLIHSLSIYDVLRIDHFRAFADYYTIAFGSKNAKTGRWEKGAGLPFWKSMQNYIGSGRIIAEDLGGETPEVEKLVKDTGFPNMKVLQFAFDSDLQNKFLPRNYNPNCVCYTGTHDNDTTVSWYEKSNQKEKIIFEKIVPKDRLSSPCHRLIKYGMNSVAKLVIIPIQDYLCLGSEYRMNTPGTEKGNWEYRLDPSVLNEELIEKIKYLTKGRNK